jgi:hypothetical protein
VVQKGGKSKTGFLHGSDVSAGLVSDLLNLGVQECHPNDSLHFFVECRNVVGEHSTRTEAVKHNWSGISF